MPNFILYLLLSLGVGGAYALLAQGVVSIYKGSGVLNFGQGAVGMAAAYCFYAVTAVGVNKYLALVVVIAGSALAGAVFAVGILRALRSAPPLARAITTLGLMVGLQGIVVLIWGNSTSLIPQILPTSVFHVKGNVTMGVNLIYMTIIAIVICVLLMAVYMYSRIGLATQAASENERGVALLGFSPPVIEALNWAVGFALAAFGGVLIASLTSLDTSTLPLLVLPALAAALVGRFSSFAVTTVAAFAIGWAQIWLFNDVSLQSAQNAAPFVVVVILMVVAGRALPTRGAVAEGRPPHAPPGRFRWPGIIVCGVAAVAMLVTFNTTYQSALEQTIITALLGLSLVVVTGYSGQISLMQLTFAGLGGLLAAKIAVHVGVPFPFSIIVSALIVTPIGVLLGLPSLRVRGMSLAVVTLGGATAIDAVLFQSGWAGGTAGLTVPVPHLWGYSLNPFVYPVRFGAFLLIVLFLAVLVIGNLRRSGAGRQMLAIRSNERAAAVSGVNVSAVKLKAFALASAVAAVSGAVLAYENPFFTPATGQFAAMPSITLVTVMYMGGIASVGGAIIAGVICSGGIIYELLSGISGFSNWYLIATGVGLVWTVIANPDGVAPLFGDQVASVTARVGRRIRPHGPTKSLTSTTAASPEAGATAAREAAAP